MRPRGRGGCGALLRPLAERCCARCTRELLRVLFHKLPQSRTAGAVCHTMVQEDAHIAELDLDPATKTSLFAGAHACCYVNVTLCTITDLIQG